MLIIIQEIKFLLTQPDIRGFQNLGDIQKGECMRNMRKKELGCLVCMLLALFMAIGCISSDDDNNRIEGTASAGAPLTNAAVAVSNADGTEAVLSPSQH